MGTEKKLQIGLIGYGKMGTSVERIARQRGHHISLIVADASDRNKIREMRDSIDVLIEFTGGESAFENIMTGIRAGIPVVSGSTGWLDQLDQVTSAVKELDGCFFYASNFSIGVHLFLRTAKFLSKLMDGQQDYDVLIEETHHIYKKDAPSGTAISLADTVLQEFQRKKGWALDDHNAAPDILPIVAKRIGHEFGHHRLIFHSQIDTVELEHKAYSRDGFALGAVMAAEFSFEKKGYFGMDDLLPGL
jgi:4-hydroxy-tetrahydrodipicolinate reductase